MKFFYRLPIILKSNYPMCYWAYPYDVLSILEPFHLSNFLYSTLHNQRPKNGDPSTKDINFIETKVTAINCRVLTFN